MPLVAVSALAYAAGLLLGFGGVVHPVLGAAAVVGAIAAWRRELPVVAVAAILAAGVLIARADHRLDSGCIERAGRAQAWRGTVDEQVMPGGRARATLHLDGCTVDALLLVERGEAQLGSKIRATGRAVAGRGMVLVRDARVVVTGPPGPLARLRAWTRQAIDEVFRGDAAIARALLIADQRSIAPELRDRYADAGLVHMLSVSGLHVGIIAAAAQLLLQAARLPRRTADLAAVALTGGYVLLIGAPAPAVRSGVMLAGATASRLLQRPTSAWAGLAVGASVPLLLDSDTVLDLGWQLSAAGIAALIAAGALARRGWPRWRRPAGWRFTVARDLTASMVATLVSAPLVAWTFGRVSLVAPLTNLAAAPLMALLQPMLFLALLLAPVSAVARFVADAAHPLLRALDAIAATGAALPLASIAVAPTLLGAACAGIAAAAGIVACTSRQWGSAAMVGMLALVVAAWHPLLAGGSGGAELHVLDVGQGDAIALRTPRGRWVLFDAGPGWRSGDAGRRTVVPYVRRRGGAVSAFVLSHPHTDHVGGAATVLTALRPSVYWDGAYVGTAAAYRESLVAAARAAVAWRRVVPGDSMVVDGVVVTFLAPDSAWTAALNDPNEASVVALVRYGAVRFLLMGDAEAREEEWLLHSAPAALRAHVLKIGHHGSRTSSTDPLLDAVAPRIALISVGAGNEYGHPSPDVVEALTARGTTVLRTDQWGTIVVRTDGTAVDIEAAGARWSSFGGSSKR